MEDASSQQHGMMPPPPALHPPLLDARAAPPAVAHDVEPLPARHQQQPQEANVAAAAAPAVVSLKSPFRKGWRGCARFLCKGQFTDCVLASADGAFHLPVHRLLLDCASGGAWQDASGAAALPTQQLLQLHARAEVAAAVAQLLYEDTVVLPLELLPELLAAAQQHRMLALQVAVMEIMGIPVPVTVQQALAAARAHGAARASAGSIGTGGSRSSSGKASSSKAGSSSSRGGSAHSACSASGGGRRNSLDNSTKAPLSSSSHARAQPAARLAWLHTAPSPEMVSVANADPAVVKRSEDGAGAAEPEPVKQAAPGVAVLRRHWLARHDSATSLAPSSGGASAASSACSSPGGSPLATAAAAAAVAGSFSGAAAEPPQGSPKRIADPCSISGSDNSSSSGGGGGSGRGSRSGSACTRRRSTQPALGWVLQLSMRGALRTDWMRAVRAAHLAPPAPVAGAAVGGAAGRGALAGLCSPLSSGAQRRRTCLQCPALL